MKTLAILSVLCFPFVYLAMIWTMTGKSYHWMMGVGGMWLLWGIVLYTRRQGWWELALIVMSALGMVGLFFLKVMARAMMPI